MNDEGSIQLSTLKQIIQQRKKKFTVFEVFFDAKILVSKKSSHTQKLPFLQLKLSRLGPVRDFKVLNEIHLKASAKTYFEQTPPSFFH